MFQTIQILNSIIKSFFCWQKSPHRDAINMIEIELFQFLKSRQKNIWFCVIFSFFPDERLPFIDEY